MSWPSVEDFRQFTNNAIGNRRLVEREARNVIRVIIAAADSWRKQSFETATQHCLGSYLYPDSVSDGAPAVELYLASSLPPLTKLSRGSFEAQARENAGGWFDQSETEEPYIFWLCGTEC